MTVQAQPVSVSAEAGISGTASASADTRAHLTSATTALALSVQDRMLRAARSHLTGLGFTELLPPILGPVTDPGVRGAKQVDIDYYGHRYKLMTSAILYKQASLLTFERIFYVAPNIRLEPLETANTGLASDRVPPTRRGGRGRLARGGDGARGKASGAHDHRGLRESRRSHRRGWS